MPGEVSLPLLPLSQMLLWMLRLLQMLLLGRVRLLLPPLTAAALLLQLVRGTLQASEQRLPLLLTHNHHSSRRTQRIFLSRPCKRPCACHRHFPHLVPSPAVSISSPHVKHRAADVYRCTAVAAHTVHTWRRQQPRTLHIIIQRSCSIRAATAAGAAATAAGKGSLASCPAGIAANNTSLSIAAPRAPSAAATAATAVAAATAAAAAAGLACSARGAQQQVPRAHVQVQAQRYHCHQNAGHHQLNGVDVHTYQHGSPNW